MFPRVRKRITYTNLALTLALVFAMSGGAYAASRYVITSTKQIKPSVLKSLQGKTGPAGQAGSNGATGAPGPAGTNGTNGEKGEKGATGATGATGTTGAEGKFPATLGKGTESGTWSISYVKEAEQMAASISFALPLADPLDAADVHYVNEDGTEEATFNETTFAFGAGATSDCPGNVAEPAAAPGNLCVYQQHEGEGVEEVASDLAKALIRPATAGSETLVQGASTSGAFLKLFQRSGESSFAHGTWAVTAP